MYTSSMNNKTSFNRVTRGLYYSKTALQGLNMTVEGRKGEWYWVVTDSQIEVGNSGGSMETKEDAMEDAAEWVASEYGV